MNIRVGVHVAMLALSILAAPLAAETQQAVKAWRIGFFDVGTAVLFERHIEAIRLGLREHGYVQGRNITVELRWAEGRYDRLPTLAAKLAAAYATYPEHFPAGPPHPPACPSEVWINPPECLIRSQASSNAQPSHLLTRRPSPSPSSIAAPQEGRTT